MLPVDSSTYNYHNTKHLNAMQPPSRPPPSSLPTSAAHHQHHSPFYYYQSNVHHLHNETHYRQHAPPPPPPYTSSFYSAPLPENINRNTTSNNNNTSDRHYCVPSQTTAAVAGSAAGGEGNYAMHGSSLYSFYPPSPSPSPSPAPSPSYFYSASERPSGALPFLREDAHCYHAQRQQQQQQLYDQKSLVAQGLVLPVRGGASFPYAAVSPTVPSFSSSSLFPPPPPNYGGGGAGDAYTNTNNNSTLRDTICSSALRMNQTSGSSAAASALHALFGGGGGGGGTSAASARIPSLPSRRRPSDVSHYSSGSTAAATNASTSATASHSASHTSNNTTTNNTNNKLDLQNESYSVGAFIHNGKREVGLAFLTFPSLTLQYIQLAESATFSKCLNVFFAKNPVEVLVAASPSAPSPSSSTNHNNNGDADDAVAPDDKSNFYYRDPCYYNRPNGSYSQTGAGTAAADAAGREGPPPPPPAHNLNLEDECTQSIVSFFQDDISFISIQRRFFNSEEGLKKVNRLRSNDNANDDNAADAGADGKNNATLAGGAGMGEGAEQNENYLAMAAINALLLYVEDRFQLRFFARALRVEVILLSRFCYLSRSTARALYVIPASVAMAQQLQHFLHRPNPSSSFSSSSAPFSSSSAGPFTAWQERHQPPQQDSGASNKRARPLARAGKFISAHHRDPDAVPPSSAAATASSSTPFENNNNNNNNGSSNKLYITTLIEAVPRCSTAMGRRQLRTTLLQPLRDYHSLQLRLDVVSFFVHFYHQPQQPFLRLAPHLNSKNTNYLLVLKERFLEAKLASFDLDLIISQFSHYHVFCSQTNNNNNNKSNNNDYSKTERKAQFQQQRRRQEQLITSLVHLWLVIYILKDLSAFLEETKAHATALTVEDHSSYGNNNSNNNKDNNDAAPPPFPFLLSSILQTLQECDLQELLLMLEDLLDPALRSLYFNEVFPSETNTNSYKCKTRINNNNNNNKNKNTRLRPYFLIQAVATEGRTSDPYVNDNSNVAEEKWIDTNLHATQEEAAAAAASTTAAATRQHHINVQSAGFNGYQEEEQDEHYDEDEEAFCDSGPAVQHFHNNGKNGVATSSSIKQMTQNRSLSLNTFRNRFTETIENISSYTASLRSSYNLPSLKLENDFEKLFLFSFLHKEGEAQHILTGANHNRRDNYDNSFYGDQGHPFKCLYAGGSHFELYMQAIQSQQRRQQQQQQQQQQGQQQSFPTYHGGDSASIMYLPSPCQPQAPYDLHQGYCGTRKRNNHESNDGGDDDDDDERGEENGESEVGCNTLPAYRDPVPQPEGAPATQRSSKRRASNNKRIRCTTDDLEELCREAKTCMSQILGDELALAAPFFRFLRRHRYIGKLQAISESVGLLDMLVSFSLFSVRVGGCRPVFYTETETREEANEKEKKKRPARNKQRTQPSPRSFSSSSSSSTSSQASLFSSSSSRSSSSSCGNIIWSADTSFASGNNDDKREGLKRTLHKEMAGTKAEGICESKEEERKEREKEMQHQQQQQHQQEELECCPAQGEGWVQAFYPSALRTRDEQQLQSQLLHFFSSSSGTHANNNNNNNNSARHHISSKIVPNTLRIPHDKMNNTSNNSSIFILTGPNNAGKTQFLRQVGQLQVLAQSGCFVPSAQFQFFYLAQTISAHLLCDHLPFLSLSQLKQETLMLAEVLREMQLHDDDDGGEDDVNADIKGKEKDGSRGDGRRDASHPHEAKEKRKVNHKQHQQQKQQQRQKEQQHKVIEKNVLLVDELGRSTSPSQGRALLAATIEYLIRTYDRRPPPPPPPPSHRETKGGRAQKNKSCFCVFSSHYVHTTRLADFCPHMVHNIHFALTLPPKEANEREAAKASEAGGGEKRTLVAAAAAATTIDYYTDAGAISLSHELLPGPCQDVCYGLLLAKQIGLLPSVMEVALRLRQEQAH